MSVPVDTRPSRVAVSCLVTFGVVWIVLAVNPRYRMDWLLENIPTFVAVPIGVLTARRFTFSDRAYVQMTAFLILHTIGSHYTYSEVPFGAFLRDGLDLGRNHYDRLVHFLFGVLFVRPIRELAFGRGAVVDRPTQLALAVCGVACGSLVYEVVEWITASLADPAAGTAYLGTQGDPWDAEKDMALAVTGALVALPWEPREVRTRERLAGTA